MQISAGGRIRGYCRIGYRVSMTIKLLVIDIYVLQYVGKMNNMWPGRGMAHNQLRQVVLMPPSGTG